DLRSEDDPEGAAHRWMQETFARPLDMIEDRLIGTTLLQLADDRFLLSSFIHHNALDGHAAEVMLERCAEIYSAWVKGEEPPPCKALPIEKILEFESAYTGSKRQATDRAHWLKRLADLPEPLSLVDDVAPPAAPARYAGA